MNTVCPNGHPNRSGAKFCSVCGTRIPAPAVTPAPVAVPVAPASSPDAAVVPGPAAEPTVGPVRFPFGLIPTLPGTMIVLVGFFMDWLVIGTPLGNFFMVMTQSQTLSGYKILTTGPTTFHGYPIAAILVIPGLAVVALLLTALTAIRLIPLRWLLSGIQLLLAAGGIFAMVVVLSLARSEAEQILKSFGFVELLSQMLSQAVVKIEPGLGLFATAFGFILIGLGALVDFFTQLIWR